MTLLLLGPICVALMYAFIVVRIRHYRGGPFLLDAYLFGLFIYTVGSVFLFFVSFSEASEMILNISLACLSSSLIATIGFLLLSPTNLRPQDFQTLVAQPNPVPIEENGVKIGAVCCSLVMLAFFVVISNNPTVVGFMQDAFLGIDGAFLSARKAMTSGEHGYFAPGFVKQFRDILAPIILASMLIQFTHSHWTHTNRLWFCVFLMLTLFSMLVTGQRLVLVVLFLCLIITWLQTKHIANRNLSKKSGVISIVVGSLLLLGLFILSTTMLGRLNGDGSVMLRLVEVVTGLFRRIFLASPGENAATFEHWAQESPTYGRSWLAELANIAPGQAEEGLSNKMHQWFGGSSQGNSPLGLAPDIWLAWSWPGLLLVPMIYVPLIGLIDRALTLYRSPLLTAAKIFMLVSLPIMYSPYGFLLYGGAATLILLLIVFVSRQLYANKSIQ